MPLQVCEQHTGQIQADKHKPNHGDGAKVDAAPRALYHADQAFGQDIGRFAEDLGADDVENDGNNGEENHQDKRKLIFPDVFEEFSKGTFKSLAFCPAGMGPERLPKEGPRLFCGILLIFQPPPLTAGKKRSRNR